MKRIFDVALNINDDDIQISLHENGKSPTQILLGGINYAVNYSGPEKYQESILKALEENFRNKYVTAKSMHNALNHFGDVAVSELSEKLKRSIKQAKLIGKGMLTMQERAQSTVSDEARGRMIEEPYFYEVKKNQEEEIYASSKRLLFNLWKEDASTKFSFPEWESVKQKQWRQSKDGRDFLPWVYHQTWKNSGTKDDMFTWFLRRDHKAFKIPIPFNDWKKEAISHITKDFGEMIGKPTPQKEILNLWLEQMTSGLNVFGRQYIEFKNWQKSDHSETFSDWMLRKNWEDSKKQEPFERYREIKLNELNERWGKSGMEEAGMDFDTWRKFQDPTLLTNTGLRPFIHCNDQTRAFFKLDSTSSGALYRNNVPYSTEYETTLHSGDGYAIFVVGPDEEIYAASHIPSVFHHSSFFSDSAVLAGGELRMGLDLKVEHSKDEKQKQELIKIFTNENKDPYKLQLIKNDKTNSWTLTGDSEGKVKSLEIPQQSPLGQTLQKLDLKDMSFATRATILDLCAKELGRPNPRDQVTLLSSKSGHYHPSDEENYYMLKLWEKRGIDLNKIAFASLGSSTVYRSAQEYIDEIEPAIKSRQKSSIRIQSGCAQDNLNQPIRSTEKTIVINKQAECYLSDNLHKTFKHPEIIDATHLPGFSHHEVASKQNIQSRIENLNSKKAQITNHITELDQLIKQTSKSARAKRSGRLIVKETEQKRLEQVNKEIAILEKALKPSRQPGKQEIRGGGIITTNEHGKIEKIDAKIGDYALSEKEVRTTLLTLKKNGAQLDKITLVVYDKSGTPAVPQNANQYLIDKYAAGKTKPELPPLKDIAELSSARETMNKYKVAACHAREENPSQLSDESSTPTTLKH